MTNTTPARLHTEEPPSLSVEALTAFARDNRRMLELLQQLMLHNVGDVRLSDIERATIGWELELLSKRVPV